ncbi:phosphoribosyltransferase-like protein [Arthrobacter sp. TMS2-4]
MKQFLGEEKIAAGILLDSILVTTTDQIKSDIEAAIQDIISSSDNIFYLAPIVSKEDVLDHLEIDRKANQQPRMFDDYQPLDMIGKNAGSENYLALVARDIRKRYGKQAMFGGSVDEFKKVTSSKEQIGFIFIVDNSMSGSQVAFFMNSFWSSELVSSLLAGKQTSIQIHLVCWGATGQVIKMLDSAPEYLRVNRTIVCEVPTVETSFPAGDALDAVMHIIQKYPKIVTRPEIGKRGLGYKDTGALFLPLGSSAPNNMPDLLIRSAPGRSINKYAALFDGRRIPPDVKALSPGPSPLPLRNPDFYNQLLRKQKLLTAAKITKDGQSKEWAMVLLMALRYSPSAIRGELGLSYIESRRVLNTFKEIGWATNSFTLTELGYMNLRKFGSQENYSEYRSGIRFIQAEVDGVRGAYYPKAVRGVS